jgi:transcriptional regulator with PAS, ATPase and Fis domain
MIHQKSALHDKPFVAVNCASIPDNLMESEFFGYEKGAFTGAVASKKGRFEEADGGTLFLDEIGDLPLHMQPKFLRAIEEGGGSRLGSNKTFRYEFRIISATNKDLHKRMADGLFREDLFYRLFSVEIRVPPLRERCEDIVPLALSFMDRVSKRFMKKVPGFSPEVLNSLEEYPWPGNVRQLLHEIERMVALTPEEESVSLKGCSQALTDWKNTHSTDEFNKQSALLLPDKIRELEIACIKNALLKTKGNKLQASKMLGITRQGLDKKIKRYKINS